MATVTLTVPGISRSAAVTGASALVVGGLVWCAVLWFGLYPAVLVNDATAAVLIGTAVVACLSAPVRQFDCWCRAAAGAAPAVGVVVGLLAGASVLTHMDDVQQMGFAVARGVGAVVAGVVLGPLLLRPAAERLRSARAGEHQQRAD